MSPVSFSIVIVRLLLGLSFFSLGAALFGQYGMGLQPCILCHYQRIPYMIIALLAFIALLPSMPLENRVLLIKVCALIFLAGASISFYHIGVEQHWWEGTKGCGGGPSANDIESLKAQIMNAPIVRCDQIGWEFLGISIPGYNFIWQIFLAGVTLFAASKIK